MTPQRRSGAKKGQVRPAVSRHQEPYVLELEGSSQGGDAFAFDAGSIEKPIRNWADLTPHLPGEIVEGVARRATSGNPAFIVLRYQRDDERGVLCLRVGAPEDDSGQPTITALSSASTDPSVRRMRGGPDAPLLASKRVAVVGVGAIGSFTADILARSGVGHVDLYDHERVRPGNIIRHLATADDIGDLKIDAVRRRILAYALHDYEAVGAYEQTVALPFVADHVLATHDITVDATADSTGSNMLIHFATESQRNLISVAVFREGGIARADRFPLRTGESHAAAIPYTPGTYVREAGCGDPVSMTPPVSVLEAAVLASRLGLDVLTERFALPPSISHVLTAQSDPPYDRIGTLA